MPRPRPAATHQPGDEQPGASSDDRAADLNFSQAQAALELCLAQLQASDLDVEMMAGLYSRAQAYADRCATILAEVEQEVLRWDPEAPEQPPCPHDQEP